METMFFMQWMMPCLKNFLSYMYLHNMPRRNYWCWTCHTSPKKRTSRMLWVLSYIIFINSHIGSSWIYEFSRLPKQNVKTKPWLSLQRKKNIFFLRVEEKHFQPRKSKQKHFQPRKSKQKLKGENIFNHRFLSKMHHRSINF